MDQPLCPRNPCAQNLVNQLDKWNAHIHMMTSLNGTISVWLALYMRGIHRSPVDSSHKGQWHGALMLPLISAWTRGWADNRDAGDLRRHCAHYDVTIIHLNTFLKRICSGISWARTKKVSQTFGHQEHTNVFYFPEWAWISNNIR